MNDGIFHGFFEAKIVPHECGKCLSPDVVFLDLRAFGQFSAAF